MTIRSAFLLFVALVVWLGSIEAESAGAQDPIRVDTVYRPLVAESLVQVEMQFTLGAAAAAIETYVPGDATNFDSNVPVNVEPEDEFWSRIVIDLGASTTGTARLTYDLPSAPPRGEGDTRVNAAHVSFFVEVDPFLANGSIRIVTPEGFAARVPNSLMEPVVEGGELVWVADPIPDPETFFFRFVASNEDGLTLTDLSVENERVTIASWSDDPEWLDFATEQVTSGVPLLSEMIGLPWPTSDLIVAESAAPALRGYAGWYDQRENQIEVGDQLDQWTMLHELSHAWFNQSTSPERWIYEGLAEEFSSRATVELGGSAETPETPDNPPSGYDGLATWGNLGFFENTLEVEYYSYRTSHYVMRELTDEIGVEGVARVVNRMLERELTYAAPEDPPSFQTNDWRRFLDLLELEEGSEIAAPLFEEHVLPASEVEALERRADTMAAYESFRARTSDLGMPLTIRESMSRWEFDRVQTQIEAADEIVGQLDLASARAGQIGMTLPPFLAERYRNADGGFGPVTTSLDETNRMLDTIIGRGTDAPSFESDRRNFEIGRFELIDGSSSDAGRLNRDVSSGSGYGVHLVILGVLVVGLILLGGTALVLGNRPDRPAAASSPPPAPMPPAPSPMPPPPRAAPGTESGLEVES